jgi:hypothetical protein
MKPTTAAWANQMDAYAYKVAAAHCLLSAAAKRTDNQADRGDGDDHRGGEVAVADDEIREDNPRDYTR